ncbi:MAG: exosortase/archaeosortase family protein [Bryobacteraceae bacterium]
MTPAQQTLEDKLITAAKDGESGPGMSRQRKLGLFIYLVIVAVAFAQPIYRLFVYVLGTTLHSHAVLIPFITGYLISIERASWPRIARPSYSLGVPLIFVGIISFLAMHSGIGSALSENDRLAGFAFSFLSFIWAGGFLFLGRSWMSATAFAAAFLIFMVPLPDAVASWLETASKYASAEAAALWIGVMGLPHVREGLIFRLPGISIEVAQECSGIRSSWVLFITSLLGSYLFLRSSWRRAVLVAFVIPLGIIRNGFRIAVISWLCVNYGPQMINSSIHHRGGPIFFVMSLIPLFLLLWWLWRGEEKKRLLAAGLSGRGDAVRP